MNSKMFSCSEVFYGKRCSFPSAFKHTQVSSTFKNHIQTFSVRVPLQLRFLSFHSPFFAQQNLPVEEAPQLVSDIAPALSPSLIL